ncbi:MAG: 4Fe-4S binding protein [Bacillota bacterium]
MAIPYWLIKNNMALNISWPLYAEVLWAAGGLLAWYAVVSFVFVPVVVFLFGRRAWCTFICGTGVLAETLGNDYRIFGSKAKTPPPGFIAIKWIILVLTVVFTVLAFSGFTREKAFSLAFMIVFILLLRTLFMQAVNIILMPKLGTRIWCKYFCPQGLLIGLISSIGRFALVKDESLCTGCGICNQHCSMSIDITGGPAVNRSGECVGCGVCVEVCPQKALSMTTGAVSGVEKSDKVGV